MKPEIQEAIQEAQRENAARNAVTISEITSMQRAAYQVAQDIQQPSAMSSAAHNLAKLHGLIVDKITAEQFDPKPMEINITVLPPEGELKITRGSD